MTCRLCNRSGAVRDFCARCMEVYAPQVNERGRVQLTLPRAAGAVVLQEVDVGKPAMGEWFLGEHRDADGQVELWPARYRGGNLEGTRRLLREVPS